MGPIIPVMMFRPQTPNRIEVKKTGSRYRNRWWYQYCLN